MTSVIVEWIKESALHLFATSALCYLSCAIVGLACLTTGGLPPTFTIFERSKALNGARDGGLAILVGATTIATTTNIIAIEGGFSDSGASGSDGGGGSSGESGAGGGCGEVVETGTEAVQRHVNRTLAQIRQFEEDKAKRQFEMLTMDENETIREFSGKMMGVVNQLRLLGKDMFEERLINKMLVSLPERYKSKISSLEDSRDIEQMTLKELVNALEGLEQKKAVREKGLIESALIAKCKNLKFGSSNSRSNDVDKKNKGKKIDENREFEEYLRRFRVMHHLIPAYSPQQNGISERKNRTLMEMFRCLLFEIGYAKIPDAKRTKLDKNSLIAIHLGYSEVSKGYRLLDVKTMKVFVSRNVAFDENKRWNWDANSVENTESKRIIPDHYSKSKVNVDSDENVDEPPVRGARSLQDIYSRCYVFVTEPSSFAEVPVDEKWKQAMEVEMSMIRKNQTWILVKKSDKQKVIGVKWVYRTKLNSDGSVNKYKARLVVKGFSQVYGVDYLKTFAPVARHDTIKLLVGLAAKEGWLIWHFDIQSAFLNGTISEAFMLNSQKALLNQERKIWYASSQRHYMDSNKPQGLGPSNEYLDEFKTKMKNEFDMSDLEVMPYFLRLQIIQNLDFIFLHQKKYTGELLKKFRMDECKVVSTPLVAGSKFTKDNGGIEADVTQYRRLIGCLLYLLASRPNIMFATSLLSRFMQAPSNIHWIIAKRILRYVKGTLDFRLKNNKVESEGLKGYSDSDWSSAEAEYISAAAATNQPLWIKKNMEELNTYESNFMPSGKLLRIKKFRSTDSNQSGSQRSQTSSELLPVGDPQFPYYLHHTDHPGSVVINPKLTTTNYVAWNRSFLLALSIRNKLGFINGSIPKPQVTDDLYSSWIRCNNLIVAWILDSISPPIASTIFYMDSAMEIWSALKQSYAQPDDTRVCNLQYTIGSVS
ncbi:Reverse transcriptase [Theobroma cacao]|nr:Reverse transcriptase [Theobroma cacao]